MNASHAQVGKMMRCPECDSLTVVTAPKAKPKVAVMDDDVDEYRLAEGTDQPTPKELETVSLICTTCHELLHAKAVDAGKLVKCNYCQSENVIPRKRKPKPDFVVPDISDVHLDAPPPEFNAELRAKADSKMAGAHELIAKREAEEDVVPKNPFVTGVVNYPFYLEALPIALGIGIGIAAFVFLWQMLNGIMDEQSVMMISGVFVMNIMSFGTIGFLLLISPPLLTIIEYTAVGRDKVDQFPKSDLWERGFAAIVFLLSFAVASAPGLALVRMLNLPVWVGFLATPFLFPVVLISILEANSLVGIVNRDIIQSLFYAPVSWFQFVSVTTVLLIGILLLSYSLSYIHPRLALIVGSLCAGFFAVFYVRFLGRLAWVIVDLRPVEANDADDDDE